MGKKTPVHVEVKPRHRDEPIERLIKRFMKKVKNERLIEKVLSRKRYEKPSVKRRREKLRKSCQSISLEILKAVLVRR